ncbi:MAG: Resuscitation-promoting factor Rpf1 [Actinomycetia bacterium]|nr:Resuscitation-promoting factor Rpf1 [Actinomycetes bacterium]
MISRWFVVGLVIAILIVVGMLAVTLNEKSLDGPPPDTVVDVVAVAPTRGLREEPSVTVPTTSTSTTVATARSAPNLGVVPLSTWDALARCESGGNWADTRGGYEGGVHFMHDTWVRAGGRRFAEHAYLATRLQQIEIAASWLRRTSWRQWPSCSLQLGLR